MKFIFCVILIFVLAAATTAATARGYYRDLNHPGKCVLKGFILSAGEEAQEQHLCGRMICGNDSLVTFQSCGVQYPVADQKLGEPPVPKAPYPDCCRKGYVRF